MPPEMMLEPEEESDEELEAAIARLAARLADRLGLPETLLALTQEKAVRLTPSAFLMLLLPLFEAQALRRFRRFQDIRYEMDFDPLVADEPTVRRSLEVLISSAADNPAAADRVKLPPFEEPPPRSAFSAIKAFWKNFCNIPPFCGETP